MAAERSRSVPVLLIGLLVIYLTPLLWMLATALKSPGDLARSPSGVLFAPSLDAFAQIWKSAVNAMVTSGEIAVGTTFAVIALGIGVSYSLSHVVSRRAQALATAGLAVLVFLHMVPQPSSVIPLYAVLFQWHLINTLAGVIVADVSLLLPVAILLLRPFLAAVPREVEEAARIDGAGEWMILLRIVVPLTKNGTITVALLMFMVAWGEFLYAITFLSDPSTYPISGLLVGQVSFTGASWNNLMALATLTSVPILVLFLLGQRYIVEGMTAGAIK